MRRSIALLCLAALVACSDDDRDARTTTTTASTSTTAPAESTTTASTASTTEPEPSALALRGDGLGVVALGASPDSAVAAVTAELDDPTLDTGWESPSTYGSCPGERIRGVEWGALVLLFTDGDTGVGRGEHLFTWRVSGAPPAVGTANGLGYGATAADADELYPGKVERVPAEDPFPAFLRIAAEGGTITAYLDDTDQITNLEAGIPCGE